MSIEKQIESRIRRAGQGKIFFPEDFKQLGAMGAVHTALHRLSQRGLIKRAAQGIYAKPYISKLLNKEVLPDVEEIARAVAVRDRITILPTGSYALYALGLSTQIPLKAVFYTSGNTKTIKAGNRTIVFRKAAPGTMTLKGKISKLAVQALREIGNGKVEKHEEEKIIELLKKENIKDLKHDIDLAPQWIAEIMAKALE